MLADHEQHRGDSAERQPGDGRYRGPGGLLGAVEAVDDAEAGPAAQDQAGQVVSDARAAVSMIGRRQAALPDKQGRSGQEDVDVERPAPAEPVGQRPADEQSDGRAQPAGGAEDREDALALSALGEGDIEQ